MPHICVHIPEGTFPGDARAALVRRINQAAAQAEQIPNDPRQRALCWVLVEEVRPGAWTCGAADLGAHLLPCTARVYVPAGVLDEHSRAAYVQGLHEAFERALPAGEQRRLATSVTLHEVPDGAWGVNGSLWRLPEFAQAAGFAHLQHLVPVPTP